MNSEEPLTNRAEPLLVSWEKRLAAGEIDETEWYRRIAAEITPAYLSSDNPRAQSGFIGDEAHWIQARGIIADAIDRAGTFLDVGCANGYLMESIVRWSGERGYRLEPYGLDISPELIGVARQRLPAWADRLYVGNAIDWEPPLRFDFVRTGLEYVPRRRQPDLVRRLLERVVTPAGKLIIGTCNEKKNAREHHEASTAHRLQSWGWDIAGSSERPHRLDDRLVYRVFCVDADHRASRRQSIGCQAPTTRSSWPLFHHRPCSASATTLANPTDLTSISGAA
jgi:2-polyprenyl-3-methyl-5-hydroxy-6-metoxy-1,4-benzoquinol methylase